MQQHRRAHAHGRAAHRGDQGLLRRGDRAQEPGGGRLGGPARQLEKVFHVVARGEAAGLAMDQHGAHLRVGVGRGERLRHRGVHVRAERVLLLGTVQLDAGDAVLRFNDDVCAHGYSFTMTQLRPVRLASYSAASARAMSCATVSPAR